MHTIQCFPAPRISDENYWKRRTQAVTSCGWFFESQNCTLVKVHERLTIILLSHVFWCCVWFANGLNHLLFKGCEGFPIQCLSGKASECSSGKVQEPSCSTVKIGLKNPQTMCFSRYAWLQKCSLQKRSSTSNDSFLSLGGETHPCVLWLRHGLSWKQTYLELEILVVLSCTRFWRGKFLQIFLYWKLLKIWHYIAKTWNLEVSMVSYFYCIYISLYLYYLFLPHNTVYVCKNT